jgi:LAO/AO transport system kinase
LVKRFSPGEYVNGILAGDRVMLSRAITLVESSLDADQELAQEVIRQILPHSGNSIRVGITGVPGVGKSTFIEAFGAFSVEEQGRKLAVLAVDPSSQHSGGSILGDKTRMETLAAHPRAFIRPSPARKSLGGVTRSTREAILLCEAAGFDLIFIETVGVGQSETAVHTMVDFFLLLLLAGAGDELQGMKRGIMEMADALVIMKADGNNLSRARLAQADYQAALHLLPPTTSGWVPEVSLCSALENMGIAELWHLLERFLHLTQGNGAFASRRKKQNTQWMHELVRQELEKRFYAQAPIKEKVNALRQQVEEGKISASAAARDLLNMSS